MHLVVTRSYPPEVGGMQNLMWGLTNSLSKHDLIKVFADDHENAQQFDENVSFTIERIGGPKSEEFDLDFSPSLAQKGMGCCVRTCCCMYLKF